MSRDIFLALTHADLDRMQNNDCIVQHPTGRRRGRLALMNAPDLEPSKISKLRRRGAGARSLSLIASKTQLSKVAQLYYIEEISQHLIAKRMNVSVASVSRALDASPRRWSTSAGRT